MKNSFLKENERLDDLERDNLFVIQDKTKYCFSVDSVLLSDFVKLQSEDDALELCSGCGVVSILVNAKCHPNSIVGLELNKDLFDMSVRSLEYNKINNLSFVNGDIKDYKNIFGNKKFDAIFSNPPYLKPLNDMSKANPKFYSTKYETTLSLRELLSASSYLLKGSGRLYLIYSAPRLQELLSCALSHKLFLKSQQNVFFKSSSSCALVLCEFVKKPCSVDILSPIVLNT